MFRFCFPDPRPICFLFVLSLSFSPDPRPLCFLLCSLSFSPDPRPLCFLLCSFSFSLPLSLFLFFFSSPPVLAGDDDAGHRELPHVEAGPRARRLDGGAARRGGPGALRRPQAPAVPHAGMDVGRVVVVVVAAVVGGGDVGLGCRGGGRAWCCCYSVWFVFRTIRSCRPMLSPSSFHGRVNRGGVVAGMPGGPVGFTRGFPTRVWYNGGPLKLPSQAGPCCLPRDGPVASEDRFAPVHHPALVASKRLAPKTHRVRRFVSRSARKTSASSARSSATCPWRWPASGACLSARPRWTRCWRSR